MNNYEHSWSTKTESPAKKDLWNRKYKIYTLALKHNNWNFKIQWIDSIENGEWELMNLNTVE